MEKSLIILYSETIINTHKIKAYQLVNHAFARGYSPENTVFKIIVPSLGFSSASIDQNFGTIQEQHFMTSQIAVQLQFSSSYTSDLFGNIIWVQTI